MNTTAKRLTTAAMALAAVFSLGCEKQINFLKARNELNKGVQAFSAADYAGAVQRFDTALELDPDLSAAKTYGSYAYMMQYVPGAESPENRALAEKAIAGFKEVLENDPNNKLATTLLASLYYNMKEFELAEEWHRKRIALEEQEAAAKPEVGLDPKTAESYYTIGVIKFLESFEERMKLRSELGMAQDDPGPLPDAERRAELGQQLIPKIEEGIEAQKKALEINPDYADAMIYINLLLRERADFAETPEQYESYMAEAEDWVQKTLATRKRLAEESTVDQFAEGQ